MATWPFTRARLSWSAGQRILSTMAELWDSQIAQSADGNVWTDVAMLLNFYQKSSVSNSAGCIGRDDYLDGWYTFGVSAGNPTIQYSRNGIDWTAGAIDAGAGLTPTPYAYATDGASNAVMGGTPGSSSNSKFRKRSTSAHTPWSAVTSSQTSTAGVNVIEWVSDWSLFVAGHSNGKIETSPTGSTWTARTEPNATARGQFAYNGTNGVMVPLNGTTGAYSADGATWTTTTLPITCLGAVTWNERHGKFYAFGSAAICSSSDGITWSTSGLTAPGGMATAGGWAASSGRLLIVSPGQTGVIAYSKDAAVTWSYIAPYGITAPYAFAISPTSGQLMVKDASGNHAVSIRSY